jgi:hypothetical protein
MRPSSVLVVVAVLAASGAGAAPAPAPRTIDVEARRAAAVAVFRQQPESRAIASKARRALAITTSAGPVSVWVAPTRGGGDCYLVDVAAVPVAGAGAACSPRPVPSDYVVRPWQSETPVGGGSLRLLAARVTPAVASLLVRFGDGTSEQLRPAGGFALRELRGDEDPVVVIARDADGSELRRRRMPGPRSFRRDLAFPIGPYRRVIGTETSAGFPLTFAVAPGTNGSVCERTIYRGAQSWSCGPGPARLEGEAISVYRALWNEIDDGKAVAVLQGAVGRSISRLEAWYADGSVDRIPIVEQYVLFELPRRRTPALLVGLDAGGHLVARRSLR